VRGGAIAAVTASLGARPHERRRFLRLLELLALGAVLLGGNGCSWIFMERAPHVSRAGSEASPSIAGPSARGVPGAGNETPRSDVAPRIGQAELLVCDGPGLVVTDYSVGTVFGLLAGSSFYSAAHACDDASGELGGLCGISEGFGNLIGVALAVPAVLYLASGITGTVWTKACSDARAKDAARSPE